MNPSILSGPLVLPCGQTLPNRLAKSAMSERLAGPDGAPTEAHHRLYRRWAEGGVGLSITGNVMVDPAHLGEAGNVSVSDGSPTEAWTRWAEAAHARPGALAWVQLNHPGRQAPRALDTAPVAPSAVPMRGYGAFAPPRALASAEIDDIVARFARAAGVAVRAGFDGVQVHAAHGYLVSQFLSPRTNLRDDAWGGDLRGRSAFLVAVVRAIRAEIGADKALGVKLNTADFQRGGFEVDEAVLVAEVLADLGVDLLELSGGTYERAAMFAEGGGTEASADREAFFLDQARAIRAATSIPLLLTGGFRSAAAMVQAVTSGAVDVVGLARPLAVEPDLPDRLLRGEVDRAAPVRLHTGISALDGMITGAWYQVQLERLARGEPANPALGRLSAVTGYVRDLLRGRIAVRSIAG